MFNKRTQKWHVQVNNYITWNSNWDVSEVVQQIQNLSFSDEKPWEGIGIFWNSALIPYTCNNNNSTYMQLENLD